MSVQQRVSAAMIFDLRFRDDGPRHRTRTFCPLPRPWWFCAIRRRTADSWRGRTCKSRLTRLEVLFPSVADPTSLLCAWEKLSAAKLLVANGALLIANDLLLGRE